MKPRDMQEIYEEACRTASNRPVPEPAQLVAWRQVLGFFDAKDVRAALALWWGSTATDDRGEPRSKWLPSPGELKPLCDQARRGIAARVAGPQVLVMWHCPDCGYTKSAYLSPGAVTKRRCDSAYKKTAEVTGARDRSLPQAGQICAAYMNSQVFEVETEKSEMARR
jgi:hypothetical protein